jgi:hypothetical protein
MVDSTAGKWVKFIDVFLSQIFIKKSFIWRDGDLVRKATYVYLSTGALRYVVVPGTGTRTFGFVVCNGESKPFKPVE